MIFDDILFPKLCLGCGFIGTYICPDCYKKLENLEYDVCIYCRHKSPFGLTHELCRHTNGLDGFMSIFHYNNFLKKIIETIKYRLATEVFKEFCLNIAPKSLIKLVFYKKHLNKYCLVPVPLHRKRLLERGFNQSQIIALFFQQYLGITIDSVLERVSFTKPQAKIKDRAKRKTNVFGAFSTKKDTTVDGNFIVVDDVATSGYTICEAAAVLKKAGAEKVFALTLARG